MSNNINYWFILLFLGISTSLIAQKNDPVLFTVEGDPVKVSEFDYIYSKTNGKNANYTKESLEEYLDLYVKFKLKVQRAKELQLDTIPSLMKELEGYRRQLADSYLIDKEVTDKLTREAYERSKQDVAISHILINADAKAGPADTLVAYNKALELREKLVAGADFETVAKENSQDQSAAKNGGYIGYVNVVFPNGYYNLETAAYTLPVNGLSMPVRTTAGYHILKVHDKRPARGEVEIAHILIRTEKHPDGTDKEMINDVYSQLQNGADFDEMAERFSEDGRTKEKGGYIGFLTINRFQKVFEDAAFGIPEDDAYSEPIQTQVGWHIIKRISKRSIQPYDIEKNRLETLIKRDARHEAARVAMIERIKVEGKLKEDRSLLESFADTLNEDFLTFKWKSPKEKSDKVLLQLGEDYKVTMGDFTDYMGQNSRQRLRLGRNTAPIVAVTMLYEDYLNMNCMKYEEKQLERKYPEFKLLMREYEEGILLFEATKMQVWDKASQDTAGLKEFFKTVNYKFRWDERAVATVFTVRPVSQSQLTAVRKFAETHSPEETVAEFNTEGKSVVDIEEKSFEKTKTDLFFDSKWEIGALSANSIVKSTRAYTFTKIKEIIPATNKTLKEARGYVIAEYQDHLEKKWVEQLRNKYDVSINQQVLKGLIK